MSGLPGKVPELLHSPTMVPRTVVPTDREDQGEGASAAADEYLEDGQVCKRGLSAESRYWQSANHRVDQGCSMTLQHQQKNNLAQECRASSVECQVDRWSEYEIAWAVLGQFGGITK